MTKYAAAIPKNLGLGLNFRPCSEGYFLSVNLITNVQLAMEVSIDEERTHCHFFTSETKSSVNQRVGVVWPTLYTYL